MSLEDRFYPLLPLYNRLRPEIRSFAGSLFRRLPAQVRFGPHYATFEKLAQETFSRSPASARTYQEEQIHSQLQTAWEHCPAYQRSMKTAGVTPKDFRALEDLAKFPVLTRQDLLQNLEGYRNQSLPKKQAIYMTTGGSTGQPVGFYLQRGVSRPKEQAFLSCIWSDAGFCEGSRMLVMQGLVISPSADGPIDLYEPTRNRLYLSTYQLSARRIREYLAAIRKFQPQFILAYPSVMLELQSLIRKAGEPLGVNDLKGVFCSSERLTSSQRQTLEDFFACPILHWYGHSERASLASFDLKQRRFKVWPTYGHAEFGPSEEDGVREVIATSFHNTMMPLIRYRTGDTATDIQAGRDEFTTIGEFGGRSQESLATADGRSISLTALNMHTDIFDGLSAIQFFQDTPGAAEMRYVAEAGFDRQRLRVVQAGLQEKLGPDFHLELREVQDTERTARGKHKWLSTTPLSS